MNLLSIAHFCLCCVLRMRETWHPFFPVVVGDTSDNSGYVQGDVNIWWAVLVYTFCLLLCIFRGHSGMILTHHYETPIHWQEFSCSGGGRKPVNRLNMVLYWKTVKPSTKLHCLLKCPFQTGHHSKQEDERKSREDLCNRNSHREEIPNQNLHWDNKKRIW